MALKKSELYSSLWSSYGQLRGGMDASQYKDYVLVMLFIKYVSDKYAGQPYAPITIPPGASFSDMVALKGKSEAEALTVFERMHGLLAGSDDNIGDLTELGKLAALGGVREYPTRVKCASLCWHTMKSALTGTGTATTE